MTIATYDDRSTSESPPDLSEGTVLVVDDHPVDRRLVGAFVTKVPGLRVVEAADGEEALAQLVHDRPSAILTDLQMPGMDGFELVEAIRNRDPEIPVILMTAHGSEEVAMKALRAGATNYVPKRALAADLIPTLRQVLSLTTACRKRLRLLGTLRSRSSVFRLESDPQLITPLIELLQEDLDGLGLGDGAVRMRVGVALQEALTNAVYHGNLEVSSDLRQEDERIFHAEAERRRTQEPYRDRSIHVEARIDREMATFVIRDEGPGFDTSILDRPVDPESLMRIGGRGLLLIRTFMDEVSFNDRGNQITLVKRRAVDDPEPPRV